MRQVVGLLLDWKAPNTVFAHVSRLKRKLILLDRAGIFPYEPISGLNFTKFNFVFDQHTDLAELKDRRCKWS
jgi:hypothetical protein